MPDSSNNNPLTSPQFWGQVAAPLISGGAGLIGSALQYKYNKRLMKLQNKYNIDMWKMQADYNSPQSQMQRFQEAGLNPNLIYGQGSNGNMSQAPVQGVPEAPNFTPAMQKMAEAFNIENLRTIIANRKKSEAEAQSAAVEAANEKDQRSAMRDFGLLYSFDPHTGTFVYGSDVTKTRPMNKSQRALESFTGAPSTRSFYFGQLHSGAYQRTALLNPRAQLLNAQYRYLQPQILMANYEQQHQPTTYWIGQGTKILGSLPLPKLNWSFQNKTFNKSY